jgi:hypothetical protein
VFARSVTDKAGRSENAILVLVLSISAVRFFFSFNLPLLFLPMLVHDDGLYMRVATNLASGHWLGKFDQFTLMKGPGYPMFLALTGLSGLPVSATHALFEILALLITGWAVWRLTLSRLVGVLVFIVLAFYPAGFIDELQRVFRDQVYWAQTLVILSLFSVLLLNPPRTRASQLGLASVAGLVLGWAWLTREEGIWLLPGLTLLAFGAVFINRAEGGRSIALARNIAVVVATFLAFNGAFIASNRIAYGSYVGVDFKQRDFTAAVDALQSVDTGSVTPFVPVPAAARSEVAKISPTFQPLAAVLAPGTPLSEGWGIGCRLFQQGCGDIAAGWFVWALRDAAAVNGYYQSPRIAAQKFGQIAADITAACADGKLRCRRTWISFMPAMTETQWLSLPRSLLAVAEKVAFVDPPVAFAMQSPGNIGRAAFERYWRFLNYPLVTEQVGDQSTSSAVLMAIRMRAFLARLFGIAAPLVVSVGFLAMLAAIWRISTGKTQQTSRRILVVALAAWTLVVTRIGLIALMDASTGPVVNFPYTAPANYLALLAAILSIAALFRSGDYAHLVSWRYCDNARELGRAAGSEPSMSDAVNETDEQAQQNGPLDSIVHFAAKACIVALVTSACAIFVGSWVIRSLEDSVARTISAQLAKMADIPIGSARFWEKLEHELDSAADPSSDLLPEKKQKLLNDVRVIVARWRPFIDAAKNEVQNPASAK